MLITQILLAKSITSVLNLTVKVDHSYNFLESNNAALNKSTLDHNESRRRLMFLGLLSVIGTTAPDSFFFSPQSVPLATQPRPHTNKRIPPKPYIHQESARTTPSKPSTPKNTTPPTGVNSFIENKVASTLNQKLNNEGISAQFVYIPRSERPNITEEMKFVHQRLDRIEKDTHSPVIPGDNSIKVDVHTQAIQVNPAGIPFFATINGGIVHNLQDFLNVSTATLNTITALGGVNEGVNQGQAEHTNRGDIFHRKEGNRFFFRTLISHDNSITFAQSKDNKTIDLQVNLQPQSVQNVHLADNSVTEAKIAEKSISAEHLQAQSVTTESLAPSSVTLSKIQPIEPRSILGNSGNTSLNAQTIKLDSHSLYFNKKGELAVHTGSNGLSLKELQGTISVQSLDPIMGHTLLGNASPSDTTPQPISVDPAHFAFDTNRLSLNTHLLAQISSPFAEYQGRVQQKKILPVDIGRAHTPSIPSLLNVYHDGHLLSLIGTHHAFACFYPQGLDHDRSAKIGFLEHGSTTFTIQNSFKNHNHIALNPRGGNLSVGAPQPKEKLQIGEYIYFHDHQEKNLSWNSYFENNSWKKARAGSAYQWAYNSTDPHSPLSLRSASNSDSGLGHGWLDALVINQNSLLGIGGAPTNSYQLSVHGNQKIHGRLDISRTGQSQTQTDNNSLSINEGPHTNPRIGFSKADNSEGWLEFNDGTFAFGRDQSSSATVAVQGGFQTSGGTPDTHSGYTFRGENYSHTTGIFSSVPGRVDLYTENKPRVSIAREGTLQIHTNAHAQLHFADSNQPNTPNNGDVFHHAGALKGQFAGVQRTFGGLIYANTAITSLTGGTGLVGSLLHSGFEEYGARTIPLGLFKNKWRLMRIKFNGEVTGEGNDQGSFIIRFDSPYGTMDFPIAPYYNPYLGIEGPMFPAPTLFSTEATIRGFNGQKGLQCNIATQLFAQSVFKSYPGSYYTSIKTIQDGLLEGPGTIDLIAHVPFSSSGKTKITLNQITVEILN